ncbi:hypothetical protein [Massilia sp. S19_KUP03_FR1]|uniref:hypothetical protein n=1 Tax=Massilia sp. S19_KUP03_FR1 TaxID=3025503 RepID=UPI002FCD8C09
MNQNFSRALAAAMMSSSVVLLTACGGGGTESASAIASPAQPASSAPAPNAYGPVEASFTIAALFQGTPTNANVAEFKGSSAMCSTTVAGANMCLGAAAGQFGNVVPAVGGGKCTYFSLGAAQMPRGFDIIFRASDGRTIQLTSTSNAQALTVGQTINAGFGDWGLYQPDGMQWLSSSSVVSSAIKVSAISHGQIVLTITKLPMPANTGFGSTGSIALSGTATINCAQNLESLK